MKPIIADGEIIAHYRKDCTAHDFRANVVAVLARFEAENNEKRKTFTEKKEAFKRTRQSF